MTQAGSVDISAFQKHCSALRQMQDVEIYPNNLEQIDRRDKWSSAVVFFRQKRGVEHIRLKLLVDVSQEVLQCENMQHAPILHF